MSRRHLKRYYIEWRVRPKRIGWGVISDFDKFLDCADKGSEVAQKAIINPLVGKKGSEGLYDLERVKRNKDYYRSKIKPVEFNPVGQSKVYVVDDVENDFSAITVYELGDDGCYGENGIVTKVNPVGMGVFDPSWKVEEWDRELFVNRMEVSAERSSSSLPFGACSQNGETWITAGFTLQLGGKQVFEKECLKLVKGYFNTLGAHEGESSEGCCVQAFQLAYKDHILEADEIPRSINGAFHAFVGVVHPDGESQLCEEEDDDGNQWLDAYPVGFKITMSAEDLSAVDFDDLDRLMQYKKEIVKRGFHEVLAWQFNNQDPETVEKVKSRSGAVRKVKPRSETVEKVKLKRKRKRGRRNETLNDDVEPGEEEELTNADIDADPETAIEILRKRAEGEHLLDAQGDACDEDDDADGDASESKIDEDCEEGEEDEGDEPVADVDDEGEEISEKRLFVFRIIGLLFGWAGLHFLYAKRKKSMYLSLALLLWAVVEYFLARPINFTAAPYSALRFQFAAGSVGLLWFLSVRYCEKDGCGRTMT